MNYKNILWINEAAAEAGVSTVTLNKEMNAGRLRSVKITGKRRYILREDLERWMNGLPPRNNTDSVLSSRVEEIVRNPKFLEFLESIPQIADFIRNMSNNNTTRSNKKEEEKNETSCRN